MNITCYLLYCTNYRFQFTREISHLLKHLLPANDVMYRYDMEHFAFPGNIDFAADSQGAFSCLFVCETVFTNGESRAISHTNDT